MVRVGRYGPYVQEGDNRASLPEDLAPDELTLERAREFLNAPPGERAERDLGADPASGLPVLVRAGRFGPYVQLGRAEAGGGKPKTSSLLPGMVPEQLSLEEALRLLTLPRSLGRDPATGEEVVADNGRYGPYVRRGKEYRSLERSEQLFSVDLPAALVLFSQPRRSQQASATLAELGQDPSNGAIVLVKEGRFGPYVTDGTVNASLRRGDTVEALTLERAAELLADRRARAEAEAATGASPRRRGRSARAGAASASAQAKGRPARKAVAAKKPAAKKPAAKKPAAKKPAAKKPAAKKPAAKKPAATAAPPPPPPGPLPAGPGVASSRLARGRRGWADRRPRTADLDVADADVGVEGEVRQPTDRPLAGRWERGLYLAARPVEDVDVADPGVGVHGHHGTSRDLDSEVPDPEPDVDRLPLHGEGHAREVDVELAHPPFVLAVDLGERGRLHRTVADAPTERCAGPRGEPDP